jgi:hypothetical protein
MKRLNDGTVAKRSTVGVSRALRRVFAAALVIAATSCGTDIFNFDLNLQTVKLTADFGAATGTIPPVPCNASVPAACGEGQNVAVTSSDAAVATVSVAPGCDAATSQCFGDATVVLVQPVNVLQDDAFTTRVARSSTSLVRSVVIAYAMPVNTLNFDVPSIAVYAGPGDAKSASDPGVVLVDTIPGVAAGTTFTDQRHLTIANGSDAANVIEQNINARTPFTFILVTTPHIVGGQPVPAGAFEIDLFPTVHVGFP